LLQRKEVILNIQKNTCNYIERVDIMMHYTYKTSGVCAKTIDFDIDGDIITNVVFTGGCNGNLKAVAKLTDGMTVDKIESILLGNDCGGRGTSCADQFAKAVREAYNTEKAIG